MEKKEKCEFFFFFFYKKPDFVERLVDFGFIFADSSQQSMNIMRLYEILHSILLDF